MNKFYISVFFVAALCSAQTTITKAYNDPVAGDIVNNYSLNGTPDHSAIGNGAVFNNSNLSQGTATEYNYLFPSVAEISAFPGTTLKMFSVDYSNLLKSSATKLELTGVITQDFTLNFSADNATVISYPAAFGYTETDNVSGTFTSALGAGLVKGTITNIADAYGTLLIGSKTYPNVLRIKSVQNYNLYQSTDIFYMFPIGVVTNTSYNYYDNVHKFPLFSSSNSTITAPGINQSGTNLQALSEVFLSTAENQIPKHKLVLYPNPTKDILNVKGSTKYSKAKIYTIDGVLVKSPQITAGAVQVENLQNGVYFIQFEGENTTSQTSKFIKK